MGTTEATLVGQSVATRGCMVGGRAPRKQRKMIRSNSLLDTADKWCMCVCGGGGGRGLGGFFILYLLKKLFSFGDTVLLYIEFDW